MVRKKRARARMSETECPKSTVTELDRCIFTTRMWRRTASHSVPGVLHESFGHECLKSSLAFRKPATAVASNFASRRPARADGPKVGLDGHCEGLSVQRCAWRAVQHQMSAVGGRILLADRYAWL